MKIVRRIIIAIVAVGIIAGAAYYKYINSITYFNDTDVNGNTIGNLYGNGLFCETDGVVYFANPTDYNRIYKMNPDESDIEIVANDSVYFLNADSHYVYYSRQQNRDNSQFGFLNVNINSLCRLTKKNNKVIILDEADSSACSLAGNNIVYLKYDEDLTTFTLNSVKIDATEGQQLSKLAIDPRCMVGERLYFSGVENDHNLHSMNIHSKDIAYASEFNLWMPIINKSDLYFIDLDSKHRICKATLGSTDKTVLTSYPAQSYNIDGVYLYYQSMKGNPDGLYRVDMATGAEELLAEGQFNNINITSKYVYFADYFSGDIYHCPVRGNGVSKFEPPILPLDD